MTATLASSCTQAPIPQFLTILSLQTAPSATMEFIFILGQATTASRQIPYLLTGQATIITAFYYPLTQTQISLVQIGYLQMAQTAIWAFSYTRALTLSSLIIISRQAIQGAITMGLPSLPALIPIILRLI